MCTAAALVLSLAATVGVIVFGVLQGILLAIVLAVLLFFRRSWWAHGAVLGRVKGLPGWHDVGAHPDAQVLAGVVVFTLGSAVVLRQRALVPRSGPPAGEQTPAGMGGRAMRGHH